MSRFLHPANGHTVQPTSVATPVLAFLLGPIYFAVKGLWGTAFWCFASDLVAIAIDGPLPNHPCLLIVWLCWGLAAPGIVRGSYLRKGWVQVKRGHA